MYRTWFLILSIEPDLFSCVISSRYGVGIKFTYVMFSIGLPLMCGRLSSSIRKTREMECCCLIIVVQLLLVVRKFFSSRFRVVAEYKNKGITISEIVYLRELLNGYVTFIMWPKCYSVSNSLIFFRSSLFSNYQMTIVTLLHTFTH
jgi:hypothetical protein